MVEADRSGVVGAGSRVRLSYRVYLSDGTLAEDSGEEPLEITLGGGELPAAIERCLLGMRARESGAFEFAAGEAWGDPDPERVQRLARSDFPPHWEPRVGQVVEFGLPNGEYLHGTLLAVDEHEVEVDFNHPLAGRAVRVDVLILSVARAPRPGGAGGEDS